jgi:hypothetical protein
MEPNNSFEIPGELRSMAENSFEQTRKAFETFLNSAQQAATSFEGRGDAVRTAAKDVSAKAITFAEQNVATSLDYMKRLMHSSDMVEVMKLHSEYVQGQMRVLAEQASEIGQAVTRAAIDVGKDVGKPK